MELHWYYVKNDKGVEVLKQSLSNIKIIIIMYYMPSTGTYSASVCFVLVGLHCIFENTCTAQNNSTWNMGCILCHWTREWLKILPTYWGDLT